MEENTLYEVILFVKNKIAQTMIVFTLYHLFPVHGIMKTGNIE